MVWLSSKTAFGSAATAIYQREPGLWCGGQVGEQENEGNREREPPVLGILRIRIHAVVMQAIKGGQQGPFPLFDPLTSGVDANSRPPLALVTRHVFSQQAEFPHELVLHMSFYNAKQ